MRIYTYMYIYNMPKCIFRIFTSRFETHCCDLILVASRFQWTFHNNLFGLKGGGGGIAIISPLIRGPD